MGEALGKAGRWAGGLVLLLALSQLGPVPEAAASTGGGPPVPVVPVASGATYIFNGTKALVPGDIGPLDAITCPSAVLCYAVGATPSRSPTAGTAAIVVTLKKAGPRWAITKATSDWSNVDYLDAISCSDVLHCAAAGEGAGNVPVVETTADGNSANWGQPRVPVNDPRLQLHGVSCRHNFCMAVGYRISGSGSKTAFIPGIWATSGAGGLANEAWAPANTPPGYKGTLWAVDCPGAGDCWVVGNSVFHTVNDGRSWTSQPPPVPLPGCHGAQCSVPEYDLLDTVEFVTPQQGFVGGGQQCGAGQTFSCPGAVFGTSDGGRQWSLVSTKGMPFADDISCAPALARCAGVTLEYSGYKSATSGGGTLAAAGLNATAGGNWSAGPWEMGYDYSGVACPPGGGACLTVGSFLSGAHRGYGGVFLAQPATPAGGTHSRTSSISTTIPTPRSSLGNIGSDVVGGVITLGIALFITFPANIFNETFEQNYGDIAAWWSKWTALLFPVGLRRRIKHAAHGLSTTLTGNMKKGHQAEGTEMDQGAEASERGREARRFAVVLLLGALLGSMLDPAFGFNLRTLLTYVAIALAMVVGVGVTALATSGYHRAHKHGHIAYRLEALPAGLAVAAVCVLVSRAAGFSPGYLYGVICGVHFGRQPARHEQGHLVAIEALCKVTIALAAWLAWDVVTDHARAPGGAIGSVLLKDFLAALFVSSLVSTVVGLFPLRFMPGHKLRSWHQGAWAAVFLVSLFVLVQVLLRPHGATGGGNAPLITTVVLFAVFGGASLAFREHFAGKARRRRASEGPGEGEGSYGAVTDGTGGEEAVAGSPVAAGPVAQAPPAEE